MNLDDKKKIQELDKSQMLESIEALPQQCLQAWEETRQLPIPENYKDIENIVVSGMGGSALGSAVIKANFGQDLPPLEIVNDYHLPQYVNEKTLVVLSSYSGGTEETLACAQEAKEKKAKILGITTGGDLGKFLSENNFPGYIFEPKFNFCGQPRIGLGYSTLGQMGLLMKAGILKINGEEVRGFIDQLNSSKERIKKQAGEKAESLKNRIPIIIAAEFLSGNAHVLANQFNENSKTMSFYFLLPELNHHLLEALKHPQEKNIDFLFLNSNLYSEKIRKRLDLTKTVVQKNNINSSEFKTENSNKFLQALETLWFGSFLSFSLALSYEIDPAPIPWVDYFKEELKYSSAS
ncbi:SIS domain-containing protein [Candidatus Microgenomates bacterium]|nr:SIS domain-containing protein [Candidatus Microgenomates bacterium]